jgi:release factor glutamine methyltransferase
MLTVLEIIKRTSDFFAGKGLESPRLNAELVVGHALGLPRMQLYLQFERLLGEPELEKIRPLVRRRGQREPLQYILGEMEFHGLKLKVDRRALIPRPETEWLVDVVIKRAGEAPPQRVLDLGTGSGAIALALAAAWPQAEVMAIDSSAEALALARENAAATGLGNRVSLILSDWFSQVPGEARFDLMVGNPPYLSAEETAAAVPEVREHEPVAALTAADRGLADLRIILSAAPRLMAPGGWIALETGAGQHAELRRIAAENGWTRFESLPDLAGRDRCVLAWR